MTLPPKVPVRSETGKVRRVAVVGGGAAGLMTALELARARVPVDLLSMLPARRSPSVADGDGFNAAIDPYGEGDTPERHFEESLRAGESLAPRAAVRGMTEAAPDLAATLDRMGVPFHRTGEGRPSARRLPGSSVARSLFAGAITGQQILYALDEQIRRIEGETCVDARGVTIPGEPLVRRLERWELVEIVRDESGVSVGIVAQDLRTMTCKAMPYDAVVLATGGYTSLYGSGAAGAIAMGAASAVALRRGAAFANAEMVAFHPTAIHGAGPPKVLSDAVRAEGARLWVPRDPADARAPRDIPERERDYFLERLYPEWGNLVAGDVAARAIEDLTSHERVGALRPKDRGGPERSVYLDLTHAAAREDVFERLRGATEIAARFGGADLREVPVRVAPAARATLGGLLVDLEISSSGRPTSGSPRNHATTIPGLYAVGDAACLYHGANALSGNASLARLYGATLASAAVASYRAAMARSAFDLPRSVFEKSEKSSTEAYAELLSANQEGDGEDPYALFDELAGALRDGAGIGRTAERIAKSADAVDAIRERCGSIRVSDASSASNQAGPFARRLRDLVELAALVLASAAERGESRGVHHRTDREAREGGARRATLAVLERGERRFVDSVDYACAGKPVTVSAVIAADAASVLPREVPRPHGRVKAAGAPSKKAVADEEDG